MLKGKSGIKKKIISTMLAFLMVFSLMVPVMTEVVSAAAPSTYTNISTNSTASVSIGSSGGAKYFKFVPSATGTYKFYSTNYSGDPKCSLLNSSGTELTYDDDDDNGTRNFNFTYNCTAGTTYYIKAYMYSSYTGSYTLNVQTVSAQTPSVPVGNIETTAGTNTYSLFNSGATSSSGYSSSSNPNDSSYTNSGYDIYAAYSSLPTVDLGLSFTVMQEVTERATVTIYAYDVDESSGERDLIYLVDETDGSRTQLSGYLSGMDSQWNTSTLYADANLFEVGHTYHFELTESVSGWVVYVRRVSVQLTTSGTPVVPPDAPTITDHSFSASISSSGYVTTNLYLATSENTTYYLEYAASVGGDQRGSALNQTINATTSGVSKSVSFQLESGAPKGTYQINVIVKDAQGNTVTTYTTTAGYSYSAVSYDSNGGSNNLPIDTTAYSSGNTVTVRFDYIPSRSGYTFLGWSDDSTDTTPLYTQNGTKTFTIGSSDVTLYAIWQEDSAPVVPPTPSGNGKVLLIEDSLPWGRYANTNLLDTLLSSGKITDWDKISSSSVTLAKLQEYSVVIIANYDTAYSTLNSNVNILIDYVNAGGILVYGACTHASTTVNLPGGVQSIYSSSNYNYIADADHPIVTQLYSSGTSLTDSDLYGSWCNHNYITSLPNGANVIFKDESGRATLAEYSLGDGYVIASGLTWEFYYQEEVGGQFAKKAYDDLFLYALALSGGINVCEHEEGEWIVDTEPTCGTDGYKYTECSVCGDVVSEETIPATGEHTESAWIIVSEARCESDGYKYTECTVCGTKMHEIRTPALGHDESEWIVYTQPTCGTDGYKYTECSVCGEIVSEETIPATGVHTESEWIVDREPTCLADGSEHTECTVCSATVRTEDISALGHLYVSGVCSRCGVKFVVSDVWDGTIANGFGGGTGTSADPYLIYTGAQLAYLASTTNNGTTYSGKYFKLMNNIDLNNIEWTPIGKGSAVAWDYEDYTGSYQFSGSFNGNGHIVSNLKQTNTYYGRTGLFGITNGATVSNLGVEDAYIDVSNSSYKYAVSSVLISVAYNTTVNNCYTTGSIDAYHNYADCASAVGGIIGTAEGSTISNSYSKVTLKQENASGSYNAYVGGIVGVVHGSTTISKCYYNGNINVYVRGQSAYAAGIVGIRGSKSGSVYISNCFAVCNITASGSSTYKSGVYNPWNSNYATLTNCYYNADFTSTYGTSTSISNLQSQSWISSNLGWDFTSVWEKGEDYPVLQGFNNSVSAPEHTHEESDWIIDTEPSCLVGGSKYTECNLCCIIMNTEYIPATGHSYVYSTTVEPTCTVDGYMLYECENDGCSSTKTQILLATGHDFGGDNVCDSCGFEVPLAHVHDFDEEVVEPTCTAVGYTEYTCDCGYSYKADFVDQKGHSWDEGVITTEKTCTQDGIKTRTCEACQATNNEIIRAGHEWSETVVSPATCTQDGSASRTCNACGATETDVIPAAHTWDEGTVITSPTCAEAGLKAVTCTVCGEASEIEIPKLGHRFVNGRCTVCGATIPDIIDPNEEHPEYGMYFEIDDIISNYGPDYINEYGVLLDYNEGANIEKVAVFLMQDGTMWRRCIACVGTGITYATYVPYLSYDEDIKYTGLNSDWINIFRLQENADGIWCYSDYATIGVNLEDAYGNLLLSLYDIGQAGAKTRIFDNLDDMIRWLKTPECDSHVESEWIVDYEATCVMAGRMHTECETCGLEINVQRIDATGVHTESEWIIDLAPTCTVEGYKYKECTMCEMLMVEEAIPATGVHTESEWIVDREPTCTEEGLKHKECTTCGLLMVEEIIEKAAHTPSGWITTKAATCTEEGAMHIECRVCGFVINEMTISMIPHTESGWIIDREATCAEVGSKHIECTVCKTVIRTEEIDILTVHIESDWIVDVSVTCLTDGSEHKECLVCGITLDERIVECPGSHVVSEWIVDAAPTVTSSGYRHKECTRCGEILETDITPVLAQITIEDVSTASGATITVTMDIQNNPGILGAVLTLTYDSRLTLIEAQSSGAWSKLNLTLPAQLESSCNFVWDGAEADTSDGTVLVLTFAVPVDAIGTVYEIGASYTEGNIVNGEFESIDIAIDNGSITIVELKGDVNNDGSVDVVDIITLRRYLATGYDVTVDSVQSDMNNDGEINIMDVILLRRYISSGTIE